MIINKIRYKKQKRIKISAFRLVRALNTYIDLYVMRIGNEKLEIFTKM